MGDESLCVVSLSLPLCVGVFFLGLVCVGLSPSVRDGDASTYVVQ